MTERSEVRCHHPETGEASQQHPSLTEHGAGHAATRPLSARPLGDLSGQPGDVTHATYLPLSELNARVVIKRIYR